MVSVLLIALDINILAVAVPKITTQFQSIDNVAWYSAGYLLTQMSLQPTYGRIYASFSLKKTYTMSMLIFMAGNVVCATAKSSAVLIIGRSIQGSGSAGLFSGAMSMGMYMVPKQKIPLYMAIVVSMFAVAAVVGPLLGGAFAGSSLTWRWCFWINLPIGAFSCLLILILFPEPKRLSTQRALREKFTDIDYVGSLLLVASFTCLLLGLQWGGVVFPWSDSKIWGCLLGFTLLLFTFLVVQGLRKERALIPLRFLRMRSVTAGSTFICTLFTAMTAHVTYLPFYFQSVKGLGPRQSGIYLLPYVVSDTLSTFLSAGIITVTGIYVPFMWLSAAIMMVGSGLLYTLESSSTTSKIIGYQLLTSIGFGLGIQVPLSALPSVLADDDVPTGNAIALLAQGLGGSISASIAQTLFTNTLYDGLSRIPSIESNVIVAYGATNFQSKVPPDVLPKIQAAYSDAVRKTFILPIVATAIAFLSSLAMKWAKIQKVQPGEAVAGEGTERNEEALSKVEKVAAS